jgi:nucleoside phosphorylase
MATEMEAVPLIEICKKNELIKGQYSVYQNEEFNLVIMGIGKINATLATVWALSNGAEKFINAGICGCLNDKLGLMQVCYPSVVKDLDLIQWGAKEFFYDNRDKFSIGTAGRPLHGGQERADFQKYSDLIDMESYGIASALQNKAVSFKIIKCISDFCENNGSLEIKKNLPLASIFLRDAVLSTLKE